MLTGALLAAALTTSAAEPLFVPPSAFHELKHDRLETQRLQHSGYTFITEYRTTVHEQQRNVIVPRSIVITLGKTQSYGFDAADYAQARLQSWQNHVRGIRVISSRALQICDGRRGWIFAITIPGSDEVLEQLFADGNRFMYVAMLRYPNATGDLHASSSLSSLCPPPAAHAAAQNAPTAFALPPHWSSSDPSLVPVSAPVTAQGLWLHPSVASHFIESLNLFKAPAMTGSVSPARYNEAVLTQEQQRLQEYHLESSSAERLCNGGMSAWFSAFSGVHDGKPLAIEQMTAFAPDATYMLQYVRRRGAAEDPQARKALFSLCPPGGS